MRSLVPGLFLITILISIDGSHQADCDENEFKCTNGECIDSFLVCDGDVNCADSSDETKQVCSKTHIVRCQPFAFRCTYGACINGNKKCDGKKDCADNSDENLPECVKVSPNATTAPNDCSQGFFRCTSGQCINEWNLCDGEANCRDDSDESNTLCANFPCPQILGFQCSYGGCIDKEKQCNGVTDCRDNSDEDPLLCGSPTPSTPINPPNANGCKLPKRPRGGTYQIAGCFEEENEKCQRTFNRVVPHLTSIIYSCDEGYKVSDAKNTVQKCINSEWFPLEPAVCLALCGKIESSSVDIKCTRYDQPVNCSQPVLPETRAKLKCKSSYIYRGFTGSSEIVCRDNGQWSDYLFKCEPECGIRTGNATELVSKGRNTSAVQYPWHAGLYKFDQDINKVELFCGGSIITPYLILTVAHCLVEDRRTVSANEVTVIVGKTFRDFDSKDPGEQRISVMKVFIHPDYREDDNNYEFDIALLELSRNIIIGRVTMPVCRERIPPWSTIPNGTNGTVVGWGRDEHGNLNDILQVVDLPFLDQDACKRIAHFTFKKFITHDKFCAQYINEAGVQKGDSGGGLVFLKEANGLYYIHGLVSTKPTDEDVFATFTNISSKTDFDFIEETIRATMRRHE